MTCSRRSPSSGPRAASGIGIATERFGASDPASARLRFFSGNSGTTLTAQQPLNNVIRSTIQCLGAVLGGAQSIHVMGYDEAFEIPSEEAVTLSLRTQQIIALETGVTRTADPLAGSFFVEHLTDEIEARARDVLREIEDPGGAVSALEQGLPQRWITEAAYRAEQRLASGECPKVGVNVHVSGGDAREVELFQPDPGIEERQIERTQAPPGGARRQRLRRGPATAGSRHRGWAERHAGAGRCRAGRRHRGRDERCVPVRLRRVPGAVAMVGPPLAGLRVLDLTRFVAGSQATMLLAAMGAEVVKVEVPPGDPYRWQGTERVNGESALFLALNSGKRSLALDFRKPAGRKALEGILASADMLVENSRPGSLARTGWTGRPCTPATPR